MNILLSYCYNDDYDDDDGINVVPFLLNYNENGIRHLLCNSPVILPG